MALNTTNIGEVLERLDAGWSPSHPDPLVKFLRIWSESLGVAETPEIGLNAALWSTNLGAIRLRGTDDVRCIALAGDGTGPTEATLELTKKAAAPGRLVFVLALSRQANCDVYSVLRDSGCLFLGPREIHAMLGDRNPRQALAGEMLRQLSPWSLIPYTILLSAQGNMFYGRELELRRLVHEEEVSFAIAGPGRIGKTSLVKHYRRQLVRRRDGRASSSFYLDCYQYQGKSLNEVCRAIAMEIDSSRRSARMTGDDLVQFLRYQCHSRFGRAVEIVLDEVDEICRGESIERLMVAAKQGYCRLILCGRGLLLRTMNDPDSLLASRLDLIRLEPLDRPTARKLLVEPLHGLGLEVRQSDKFAERVLSLTGRLPHLIQYYGRRLAERAFKEQRGSLSLDDVDAVHLDYETAQYFVGPLIEVREPEARVLAFTLLKAGVHHLTIPAIQQVAVGAGLHLPHARVLEICNDLVINNILVWEKGTFQIANDALVHYARELGFLDQALAEARGELDHTAGPAVGGGRR